MSVVASAAQTVSASKTQVAAHDPRVKRAAARRVAAGHAAAELRALQRPDSSREQVITERRGKITKQLAVKITHAANGDVAKIVTFKARPDDVRASSSLEAAAGQVVERHAHTVQPDFSEPTDELVFDTSDYEIARTYASEPGAGEIADVKYTTYLRLGNDEHRTTIGKLRRITTPAKGKRVAPKVRYEYSAEGATVNSAFKLAEQADGAIVVEGFAGASTTADMYRLLRGARRIGARHEAALFQAIMTSPANLAYSERFVVPLTPYRFEVADYNEVTATIGDAGRTVDLFKIADVDGTEGFAVSMKGGVISTRGTIAPGLRPLMYDALIKAAVVSPVVVKAVYDAFLPPVAP